MALVFVAALSCAIARAQAPVNDNLAAALILVGGNGQTTGTNVNATFEVGEPFHWSSTGGRSVWWQWTAPASGLVVFDTAGSNFDTILAAYTGTSIEDYTLMDNDDDSGPGTQSAISFLAVSGTTYYIAVDGYGSNQGSIVLNWLQQSPPANDNFADAIEITGSTGQISGSNISATRQAGEPFHFGSEGSQSAWWKWTSPFTGECIFNTEGSSFNTILAAYTGSALDSLVSVGANDDAVGLQSQIIFNATTGTTYYIAVDGPGTSQGSITLKWFANTPPENDDFANAISLTGATGQTTGSNALATKQAGEPNHAGYSGGRSVWWRWEAPSDSTFVFDTVGSTFTTLLAVYTGTDVNDLSAIASSYGSSRLFLNAVAGTTYFIALDRYSGSGGAFTLNWSLYNDDFGNAQPLQGSAGNTSQYNYYATKETGEPDHAGHPGGKSLWWRWASATPVRITFDTFGTYDDTLLAVYTGSSVDALTPVTSNNNAYNGSYESEVTFDANAGTEYWIAVDLVSSWYNSPLYLNWRPSNDHYDDAVEISGESGSITRSTASATKQAGEPDHAANSGERSIWFRWTPSAPMPVLFDTFGSYFDTLLAVYTGASVDSLSEIASNDNANNSANNRSELTFDAQTGTTYFIAVDGRDGASGIPTLRWRRANDNFADAIGISGASGNAYATNYSATKEPGEPDHAGNAGGRSVWWSWVAPSDGDYSFYTISTNFDTLLAVYTGSSVDNLSLLASNDNAHFGSNYTSRVAFTAQQGQTYYIAVDGYDDARGGVSLDWALTVVSTGDDFASATSVSGLQGVTSGANLNASKETGEPNHAGNAGGRSVWRKWTAPESASVTFNTTGSNFDTLLAIYTGESVDALTQIAANDNRGSNTVGISEATFAAVEGTTYFIAIDGFNAAIGNFRLNWSSANAPVNDLFEDAIVITGSNGQSSSTNLGATTEWNEPTYSSSNYSIWWRWTAPLTREYTFTTEGSEFGTLLEVYSGESVDRLTELPISSTSRPEPASRVTVDVVSGITYFIRVSKDYYGTSVGAIVLNWSEMPPPPNDNFANAIQLSGATAQSVVNAEGATGEDGEPDYVYGQRNDSIWWRWTAPADGQVEVNTYGSQYSTLISIVTGNALGGLTVIAQGITIVGFQAIQGETYYIVVDNSDGYVTLNLYGPIDPSSILYEFDRMWPDTPTGGTAYSPSARGIAVDSDGNVYVADTDNHRVVKTDSSGRFLLTWGKYGFDEGEFLGPVDIAVTNQGIVIVADSFHVRLFDRNGAFLTRYVNLQGTAVAGGPDGSGFGIFAGGLIYRANTTDVLAYWAGSGTDIAVGPDGTVYVISGTAIQRFDGVGAPYSSWNVPTTGTLVAVSTHADGSVWVMDNLGVIRKLDNAGNVVLTWNAFGYQFTDMTVDSAGSVYVLGDSQAVQKYHENGTFKKEWGKGGVLPGRFRKPLGVAVASDNSLYVADSENWRIQRRDSTSGIWTSFGTQGTGEGEFDALVDVAITSGGHLFAADNGNDCIQRFDLNGSFQDTWTVSRELVAVSAGPDDTVYAIYSDGFEVFDGVTGALLDEWGEVGYGPAQVYALADVAVLDDGSFYALDAGRRRVIKIAANGDFEFSWGSLWYSSTGTTGYGRFEAPAGLAVTSDGSVFVSDVGGHRIQRFDANGGFLEAFGSYGFDLGQFDTPRGMATDSSHSLYIADSNNFRVQKYRRAQAPLPEPDINRAVLVLGGGPYEGNRLWSATTSAASSAFKAMTQQGIVRTAIYTVSPVINLSLDGDATHDIDAWATNTEVEFSLTQKAIEPVNGEAVDNVVVYLVDHGAPGKFRLNESNEILSESDLATWLNTIQDNISGTLVIVYDACESGSFLESLSLPQYAGRRIIITSTRIEKAANFVANGLLSFSTFFWMQILNGDSVGAAFDRAEQAMTWSGQNPRMDANGNDIDNEQADFDIANAVFIGKGTDRHWEEPDIGNYDPDHSIVGVSESIIWADNIEDEDGIESVWAIVTPPTYSAFFSTMAIIDRARVDMLLQPDGSYEGIYDQFVQEGAYKVDIFALDSNGNTAGPYTTTVHVGAPPTRKAIIVNSADPASPDWDSYDWASKWAYSALTIQTYAPNDIRFLTDLSVNNAYAAPSSTALENAIKQWGAVNTLDLTIYLIGPGTLGGFWLDEGADDLLYWDVFDGWIDDAQDSIPGTVTVICDASGSGSMLGPLKAESGQKRITIASTGAGEVATFASGGVTSFSAFFWIETALGRGVGEAFTNAAEAMRFASGQNAELDDDGSGTYDARLDGIYAGRYSIGTNVVRAGDNPRIGSVSDTITLGPDESSATIWIEDVLTMLTVDYIRAVITPPDGAPAIERMLTETSPDHFEFTYDGYEAFGTYTISITAVDTRGIASDPVGTRVVKPHPQGIQMDAWETDDTIEAAQWIGVDAYPDQQHNFHQAGDLDWVKFYAEAGTVITAETANLGHDCDTVIGLYRDNGVLALPENDNRGLGDLASRVTWQVDSSGTYYAQVRSEDADFGEGNDYALRVWRATAPAVTGKLEIFVLNLASIPVSVAKVSVTGVSTLFAAEQPVESDGSRRFNGLQEGTYNVTIKDAPGYLDQTVLNVTVSESGTTQRVINLTPSTGTIRATMLPSQVLTAGARWQTGDNVWRVSGDPSPQLNPGQYSVSFKPVDGWYTPQNVTAFVTAGIETPVNVTYQQKGYIQVNILPLELAGTAQWQITGRAGSFSSGHTEELPVGNYTVTFSPAAGWNTPSNMPVSASPGTPTPVSGQYVRQTGTLQVSIAPLNLAAAAWSVDGGQTWHTQAETVTLPTGSYTLSFKPVADYTTPADIPVTIVYNQPNQVSAEYIRHTGTLQVATLPANLSAARWSTDGGQTWHTGSATVALPTGPYTVTFKPVDGYSTPSNVSVDIAHNQPSTASGTYTRQTGTLQVTTIPVDLLEARWSADGGQSWQVSGATITLPTGPYTVSFNSVADWSSPDPVSVTVIHNQPTQTSGEYERHTSTLEVTITPQAARDAGARWSIDGGQTWLQSGDIQTLPTGLYTIVYKPVPGWLAPQDNPIAVNHNQPATVSGHYSQGKLTMNLSPQEAVNAGARWSIDNGSVWRMSGEQVTLPAGSYTVVFNEISLANLRKPGNILVQLNDNDTLTIEGEYQERTGSLKITIEPSDVLPLGAKWMLDGGLDQFDSGHLLNDLAVGNHVVTFTEVTDWLKPLPMQVTVQENDTLEVTADYEVPGAIQGVVLPDNPALAGAQWRILNGDWRNNGDIVGGLRPNDYTVEFSDVPNWSKPGNQEVTVEGRDPIVVQGAYTPHTATVQVTLDVPFPADARWRLDDGEWQVSATTLNGVPVGPHRIAFKDVANWTTPGSIDINVSVNTPVVRTAQYIQHKGTLKITTRLEGNAQTAPQWKIEGGNWNNSGEALTGLVAGFYTVNFQDVSGWATPVPMTNVEVRNQEITDLDIEYARQKSNLTIHILPTDIQATARWQLDATGPWRESGQTVETVVGKHAIRMSDVAGWSVDPVIEVDVLPNQPATRTITYTPATLAKPTGLSASDGEFVDRIRLTWQPVPNATGYKIMRATSSWDLGQAVQVKDVTGTTYDDLEAPPPTETPQPGGGGCGGGGGTTYNQVNTVYWVQALGVGGSKGPWSDPDGGFVKLPDTKDADTGNRTRRIAFEAALPAVPLGDRMRALTPDGTIALRLRAGTPLDTQSIRVDLQAPLGLPFEFEWQPIEGTDNTDGWVVIRPESSWTLGDEVTFIASCNTWNEERIETQAFTFSVVNQLPDPASVVTLPEGMMNPMFANPDGPQADTRSLLVTIPGTYDPSKHAVYCYLADASDPGWFPIEMVEGMLLGGPSGIEFNEDHLAVSLTHGGLIAVGPVGIEQNVPSMSGFGDLFALLIAMTVMGLCSARNRRLSRVS
ncbi:MAG: hypothetical protein AMXMBFR84_17030 [Candidatus Hydrogenedentota bacterium]